MSDDCPSGGPLAESVPPSPATATFQQLPPPGRLIRWGILVEAGCLLVAIVLGSFGWHDLDQPLGSFFHLGVGATIVWTLAGLAATFSLAALVWFIPLRPFREFRQFVQRCIVPLFERLTLGQIALISASAGIGEEMLFRWCLQGGLQSAFASVTGTVVALFVASIVFGLCHAMGLMYVVTASLIGGLLGTIMIVSGSVVPAILTHGIYDFVAIVILRQASRGNAEVARDWNRGPE